MSYGRYRHEEEVFRSTGPRRIPRLPQLPAPRRAVRLRFLLAIAVALLLFR